jgi:hypothetical protein
VSWEDNRDGNTEIYFARLDAAGNKIGWDVRVTNDASSSSSPSLAWTGSEYGVSWTDLRDGNFEIYFARLDAVGTKIGSDVRVTDAISNSGLPSLVWTGTEYGVSWEDIRDGNFEIYFVRLSAAGAKIGSDVRVTINAASSWKPSLFWTGTEHGVSWMDERDGNTEIYFARLDATGNKIGEDLRVTQDPMNTYDPSLVWTGSEYGVSWYDLRDGDLEIYFARVGCCDDADGDGINECHDCSDRDRTAWVIPGEVQSLAFMTSTSLSWEAPASPGGTAPLYDTIRSGQAADFSTAAVCLETDDGSDTTATDASAPPSGTAFYYLVRCGNACGEGTAGTWSSGVERNVLACP